MKRTSSKRIKKSVSAILAAAMSLSLFTAIPVSADIGRTTYNYDGYSVDYNVTNEWDGAQTVELTVSNTGTDSILNWALKYDAEGEISNLWNADLYEQNGDEYVIKNVGWNFEIAPNQSVTYGYTLSGNDLSLPENFEIYSKRVDKTEGYDVQYNITKSWDTGVEGNIVITNTSSAPIEAWTLSFDSNFTIDNLWNGRVLENNGTSYTIAAEMWTNPIQPNGSMTIGFVGSKAADVEALLSNFKLTEVVIGEGMPVIPIDPPVEEIEITANAVYDEENNNITVSWNTNNPNGTFDVLMSEDGENFVSVGTVEGVSEFVYTPESDFETLYFKVVQTVGEQTTESNLLVVTKTGEEIDWNDETDTDNDGLTDVYEEYYYKTDPENPDTDGDGLPDGYEVYASGTDPLKIDSDDNGISDADEDCDKDGLSNIEEYQFETDPLNKDTDNDGLSDYDEVNTYNTDPLKYDTDGDFVSDGDEIILGLNPNNHSTNGYPDNEYTTVQLLDRDSTALSYINNIGNNPYTVSVDITSAGVADNNLFVEESGYSYQILQNKAVLGVVPEFTYSNGLSIDDVTIKYSIDNSAVANVNGKYVSVSDEFVGIKRFNIFKFFEDTNMLLPVETFHDVENNVVYTKTDKLGTYCLIDMEIWLDTLGIKLEDDNIEPQRMYSLSREYAEENIPLNNEENNGDEAFTTLGVLNANETIESENVQRRKATYALNDDSTQYNGRLKPVDVVFYIDTAKATTAADLQSIKNGIIFTSNKLFEVCQSARICIAYYGDPQVSSSFNCYIYCRTDDGELWAKNSDDVDTMLNSLKTSPGQQGGVIDVVTSELAKGKPGFRNNATKFAFITTGNYFTFANYTLNMNGIDLYHSSKAIPMIRNQKIDLNIVSPTSLLYNNNVFLYMINNYTYTNRCIFSISPETGHLIFQHIYDNTPKDEIQIISSAGLTTLPSDFGIITKTSEQDYDEDRLPDIEEIYFDVKGKDGQNLVRINDDGSIELPNFNKCVQAGDTYVQNGLQRFYQEAGLNTLNNLDEIYVLPIHSNPADADSDNDGIPDDIDLNKLLKGALKDLKDHDVNANRTFSVLKEYNNYYEITKDTNSYLNIYTLPFEEDGYIIDDLYGVDKINISSIVWYNDGYWFKILGNNGRIGYVKASDITGANVIIEPFVKAFNEPTKAFPTGNRRTGCTFKCNCATHNGRHNGQDLLPYTSGKKGDSIVAAISGKIEYVNETDSDASGIYVRVVSLDGKIVTKYMHLSEIVAINGHVVMAGTEIAKMGNTGSVYGATGPDYGTHLHFEVWVDEVCKSPLDFLEN